MAYIPYSYSPLENDGEKRFLIGLPSGGVSLCDILSESGGRKCKKLTNMDVLEDRISTRKGQKKISNAYFEGQVYSITKQPFFSNVIVHSGTKLYAFSLEDNSLRIINSEMPDKTSVFCEFLSKLYIYCDYRIFVLDENFALGEEYPESALMFDNLSPSTAFGAAALSAPLNMIAPKITAAYGDVIPTSDTKGYQYMLPRLADITRPVKVEADSKELDESLFTVTEKKLTIHFAADTTSNSSVRVTFYAKDPETIGFEDTLYGCKVCTAFGGNSSGGTRIFFTGNKDKKGYYYKSRVLDPLYVGSDEYEIFGDGCENVTSAIRMYGSLIVFTEKSVYRMTCNLTSGDVYYAVKELSCEAGCDCPGTVQLIDNRVVFANSKKGVFIVDSADDSGEHNIKPISGNILSGDGFGLLDNDINLIRNACSIDFGRRYMLLAGDRAYIWDYNKTSFAEYNNYSKAQERLCWYIYDGIYGDMLYEESGRLISLCRETGDFYEFCDEGNVSQTEFCIRSHDENFGSDFSQKLVTEIEITAAAEAAKDVKLVLYADGERYYERNLLFADGKETLHKILLPSKKLYRFSYELCGKGNISLKAARLGIITISD